MQTNNMKHKHRVIANHSPNQQRMFFAVASSLGFNAEEVKERAKKKFNTECFNDLKTGDLIYLIDKLVQVQFARGGE